MRAIVAFAFSPLLALSACCGTPADGADAGVDAGPDVDTGSDAAPPELPNPGFPVPTAIAKANMKSDGVWTEIGTADWTCLGTPSDDTPSTQAIALSGRVNDFQDGSPVGNASITAFPFTTFTGNSGTATSSNVAATRGDYTMILSMLPAGETRFGFRIESPGYLRTYVLNQYLTPTAATQNRDLIAFSESTANALPALLGVSTDPAHGTVTGVLRDCAGHEVSNVVATVSATAGTIDHLPGADTYYFSAAWSGSSSVPLRHHESPTMNKDGEFLVLGLKPQAAPAYIQIWGFTTEADLQAGKLTLLSELPSPIEANALLDATCDPRRTN